MKKMLLFLLLILVSEIYAVEILPNMNFNYKIQMAADLHNHGFLDKSLELYIEIFDYPKTPDNLKAEALYMMGQISFEKNEFKTAIDDWTLLYNDFPEHKRTEEILKRLDQIRATKTKKEAAKLSAIEIANDFYRHNFTDKAKEKFLDIYHNPLSSDKEKAQALYLVGQITFEEGNYTVAIDDWQILISKFPDSKETKEISKRISQLREIISQSTEGTFSNAVAMSYLNNGDFWSNAERKFLIDSSWMPNLEIALEWYDKILEEFPKSPAAEIAYQRKLFALFGWTESGDDGRSFGLKANFAKYMPRILKTFGYYEKDFPKSSFLQGFRYQISQAYWIHEDWQNTRKWLKKVIAAGGDEKTFYTETAKARLKKIEY